MTTEHNFQPGDRVILTGNNGTGIAEHEHLKDQPATVIEKPADMNDWHAMNVFVTLDKDPEGSKCRHWGAEDVSNYIEPAPIKMGDWVRHVSGRFTPFKVFGMGDTYAWAKGAPPHLISNLRAIVAPEPTVIKREEMPGGMTVETLSDDTKRYRVVVDHFSIPNAAVDGLRFTPMGQLLRLAEFIVLNGEPSESEGAVDCAIRIMTEQRKALEIAENARLDAIGQRDDAHVAIREAAAIFNAPIRHHTTDQVNEWLARNAPAPKPEFKRGNLVTWGQGGLHGRIIKMPGENNDMWQVIVICGSDGKKSDNDGMFIDLTAIDQKMRHVE